MPTLVVGRGHNRRPEAQPSNETPELTEVSIGADSLSAGRQPRNCVVKLARARAIREMLGFASDVVSGRQSV